MAKSSAFVVVIAMVLLCVMLMAPHAQSISCDSVTKNLTPCRSSLKGGAVTESCCKGVRSVDSATKAVADRRSACECIKKLVKSYKATTQNVKTVTSKCNVNLGFPISNNVDCSKVH